MGWRNHYPYSTVWSGFGPWSWIPPQLRPGHRHGGGWCRLRYPELLRYPNSVFERELELKYLESLKNSLTEYLKFIDKRIDEIRSRMQ
ncbi:MAG: hypothetical protein QXP68_05375 [Thermosphaera sp.]